MPTFPYDPGAVFSAQSPQPVNPDLVFTLWQAHPALNANAQNTVNVNPNTLSTPLPEYEDDEEPETINNSYVKEYEDRFELKKHGVSIYKDIDLSGKYTYFISTVYGTDKNVEMYTKHRMTTLAYTEWHPSDTAEKRRSSLIQFVYAVEAELKMWENYVATCQSTVTTRATCYRGHIMSMQRLDPSNVSYYSNATGKKNIIPIQPKSIINKSKYINKYTPKTKLL